MKTPEISSVQILLFIAMLDKALGLLGYKIVPLDPSQAPEDVIPKEPVKKKPPPLKSVATFVSKR